MQAGEKRFARRLESHLEDDYLCWYDLPVGARPRYADFIILHPLRGLLLLEVKDWKLDTIRRMDRASVTLLTNNGLVEKPNPLEQVRQCTYRLVNQLETDPQLIQQEGRFRGKLTFPWGFGVVLTHITRKQFDRTDLCEVLPPHQVICQDVMTESTDPEAFQERLWNMFNVQFSQPLTLPQIDRIRWHLFPEIRIESGQESLFDDDADQEQLVPDLIKVLDLQQEQLARSLGEGHRVIHGVAGSGKTLILGYRSLHLAKLLHKPILVLCFNIALAARLRELMAEHGVSDKVNVYHFHDWCGEQLRTFHVERPSPGDGYHDRLVERVIEAVEKGKIPRAQYGAVMIDEGHDFEPEWLRLVVGMVDPETNSLLLLYDDAQDIYGTRKGLDFTLSSVGIEARGRTTILKLNYRNTREVLDLACRFVDNYMDPAGKGEDEVPLLQPETVGRHGPPPVLKVLDSFQEEVNYIAWVLEQMHDDETLPWGDMCITYHSHWMGEKLHHSLEKRGIPHQWLGNARSKRAFSPTSDTVKLMTMHSSKGLEFPLVVVAGLGYLPVSGTDPTAEARLLYVAMTRSTDKLLLTGHGEGEFLTRLRELVPAARSSSA